MKIELLETAIVNAHQSLGQDFSRQDARDLAWGVLQYFGYGDRCLSNSLPEDMQSVFYNLEDLGLLKPESRFEILHDGREWRTIEWVLNPGKISSLQDVISTELPEEQLVYASLPAEAFNPHSSISIETENPSHSQENAEVIHVDNPARAPDANPDPKKMITKAPGYACNSCGRRFDVLTSLMQHVRIAHPMSNEDILKCINEGMTEGKIAQKFKRTQADVSYRIRKIKKMKESLGAITPDPKLQELEHRNQEMKWEIEKLQSKVSIMYRDLQEALSEKEKAIEETASLRGKDNGNGQGDKVRTEIVINGFDGWYDTQRKLISEIVKNNVYSAKGAGLRMRIIETMDGKKIEIDIQNAAKEVQQ